jgi:hypothetical protein
MAETEPGKDGRHGNALIGRCGSDCKDTLRCPLKVQHKINKMSELRRLAIDKCRTYKSLITQEN